uniref:Methylthioribose-1-phosphate isomerase n=1 Tax=Aplanochytrium stocchinoi TaxID=215587 RepID=A0A7S3PG52_9STRA
MSERPRTVFWVKNPDNASGDGWVKMIDQRQLPSVLTHSECKSYEEVSKCIKEMHVRGAPAIGAAGAYGMAVAAQGWRNSSDVKGLVKCLKEAKEVLDASRPTAVNLTWATSRLLEFAENLMSEGLTVSDIRELLLKEAEALADEDIEINKRMGRIGATVVPENSNILHHCNTGALATVDWGTAIGVIYECHAQKKNIHVWVDETRPRLQGARLSAWELMREGVPLHLIADNAAGLLMLNGKIDIVLYGADRVAANGDVANKIGTYKLSVVARENGIPVYPVVPTSTIDLNITTGSDIPIEERSPEEVTTVGGVRIAPENVPVYNPAFDVTPHRYVTGIITEEGICYPPFEMSLRDAKKKAEARILKMKEERKRLLSQNLK